MVKEIYLLFDRSSIIVIKETMKSTKGYNDLTRSHAWAYFWPSKQRATVATGL